MLEISVIIYAEVTKLFVVNVAMWIVAHSEASQYNFHIKLIGFIPINFNEL